MKRENFYHQGTSEQRLPPRHQGTKDGVFGNQEFVVLGVLVPWW
jgi:hypothetical protein